ASASAASFSASAQAASNYNVNGTQCQGTNFYQPAFGASTSGNLPQLPANYPLRHTEYYVVGEPLFLRVTDSSRNSSAALVDTLTLTVTDPVTQDSQAIIISETGPDTGEFLGFLNTDNAVATPGDCVLSVRKGDELWASYNNEALTSAALVDPYGVVFDSTSGTRFDNVRVRIVDAASGNPAAVFGDDGAPYPSEVLTGGRVTAGAITYQFAPGEFRFPLVASGQDYKLLIDQLPPGYAAPTALPDAHFASGNVPAGPYVVGAGSRQDDFPVPAGPPVRVDIPLDAASSGLFVVKSAGNNIAAIGDFVPYRVQVLNTQSASAFTAVHLHDKLPPGFRYRAGTLKVDDRPVPDPGISGDGRNLDIALGTLAAKAAFRVSYVTEITAATPPGDAQNIAWAKSGSTVSNQARAIVAVREDLMRSRALLAGRVLSVESCDAADLAAAQPVTGARIYLETGRYVLTDERGRWHFDDIRPGSHVLQLDKNGLPANAEIVSCEKHTRSAGNAQSQFVDVQGGSLWQSDFYIRKNKALHYAMSEVQEKAGLRMVSEKTEKGLRFSLDINHADLDLADVALDLDLPAALHYVPASFTVNGAANTAYESGLAAGGTQKLALGILPGSTPAHRLSWEMALASTGPASAQNVRAQLSAMVGGKALQLTAVANQFNVVQPEKLGRVIIFRPRFASFSTDLIKSDREWLDDIAADLRGAGELRLEVVGHSDDSKVVPRKGRIINDNYALSAARAQSVADYLRAKLGLTEARVTVTGKGPDEPMADNKTAKGRDTNRRVELRVFAAASSEPLRVESTVADSGEETLQWTRWDAKKIVVDEAKATPEKVATETAAEAAPELGVLSFKDGDVIANRVQPIRVRTDSRLAFELALDGREIPAERIGFTKSEGKTTLMTYIGVDFGEPGQHVLTAKGRDSFGNLRLNQSIKITVAGEITRMRLALSPENVADGRSPVQMKIELLDGSGSVVPAAVDLRLVSGELRPLVTGDVQRAVADGMGKLPLAADGLVKFAPVTRSGLYNVEVSYGKSLVEKFPVYVRPENREWILVGLAEGSLAANKLAGNMESIAASGASDDLWQDGRISFFAKGRIKGEWLLTLAYDTDHEKSASFGGAIDPTRYYTLYADASDPRYDAASRKNLYLRVEKDAFYALFGDYDTGMTVTELGRYSRTMTGLKSEYHDSRFDLSLFAADTGQAYLHDELRGNGTSGIYRLRRRNILPGSDKIRIEVRDRYKSEIVLSRQELSRFVDYNLDEVRGEVFFKSPIPSQDENFNPVWIVAEYEVEAGAGDNINAGGRGAVRFANGRAVVGLSAVQENSGLSSGKLTGLDAEFRLSPVDVLRAEVAASKTDDVVLGAQSGSASLLEWKRDSQKVKSRVYFREEEASFGLGQQSASEDGTRKMGAEGRYQFRQDLFFTADIFRQEMINSGARRDMLDVRGEYQRDAYSLSAGLRHASENLLTQSSNTEQLTMGGRYRVADSKLTLRANGEIGVNGQSGAQDFPDRLLLGADYQLRHNVTLLAEEEWAWSQDYNTQTTRAGVKYQPWKGANFSSNLDHETMESGQRLRAGLGLGQRLTLTPEWTMDLGYDQASTLKDNRSSSFNPAQPPVFGPANGDDFWAAFAGANYQYADLKGVGRIERREAQSADQWNLVGGAYRELNPEMAIAAGLTATFADEASGSSTDRSLLRGSLAWRPDRLRWLLLEQLDYGMDRQESAAGGSIAGQRLVNNLNASKRWENDQLSLQYGAKYVFATIDDSRVSGFTDLMGGEWRHDLNERWDVGLRGSVLHSWGPGVMDYSMGVSVGVTPMPNAWVSLGFNFTGFRDGDFSASEYSAKGAYLKLRLKVDQDSIRQIWNDARGVFGGGGAAPENKTAEPAAVADAPLQDIEALAAPTLAVEENIEVIPVESAAPPAAAVTTESKENADKKPTAVPQKSIKAKTLAKPAAVLPLKSGKVPVTKPAVKTATAKAAVSKVAVAKTPVLKTPAVKPVDDALTKQQRLLEHRIMVKERMQRQARLERLGRNDRTIQKVLKTEAPVTAAPVSPEKTQITMEREKRRLAKERELEIKQRRERMQNERAKAEMLLKP
ncbi:MAG: OmpA family protein, partial [Moraxellaceae bacterium]